MALCQKPIELGNGTATYCMQESGHKGDCDKFEDGNIPAVKIYKKKEEPKK